MKATKHKFLAAVALTLALCTGSLAAVAATVTVESASAPGTPQDSATMKVTWADTSAFGYALIATSGQATSVRGSTPACSGGTCTSFVTPLLGGVNYTFTVTSLASDGTQTQLGTATMRAVSIPGSPTSGSAASSGTSVTLSWNLPSNDGGLPISGCKITGAVGLADISISSTATSQVINNLAPGISYAVSMYCTNANGNSAPMLFPAFTVTTAPAAPAKPTVLLAGSSITVGWVAPVANGAAITGYAIYLVGASGADVGSAVTATASATSGLVSVVGVADATYTVQVVASNAIGASARSPKSSAVTVGTVSVVTPPEGEGTGSPNSNSPGSSLPPVIAAPGPGTPPVVVAPAPKPNQTVTEPTRLVVLKPLAGLTAGSKTITRAAQATLASVAKSLITNRSKQVTISIVTKGTTLAKAKAQAAAVAKALTKAGVTATVRITGKGSKTVVSVVVTKKKVK